MGTPDTAHRPRLPAPAAALLGVLAIVAAAFLLDSLARAQLRAHLVGTATGTLAALVHDDTPARWPLTAAKDVVTGSALGAAASRFDDAGLEVRSRGSDFEIGLVLPDALDFERLAKLELEVDADAAASLVVTARRALDAALCTSSPTAIGEGAQIVRIDLHALAWRCDDGTDARPAKAAMLRLRVGLPAGATMRLSDLRLRPGTAFSVASLQELKLDVPADAMALLVLEHVPAARWPLVELGGGARVEPTLLAIDRIREVAPAAIVVPAGTLAEVLAAATAEPPAAPRPLRFTALAAWLAVGLLALALAWVRLRPWTSPRGQALAELAGSAGVPLALLAGGAIGDDLALPTLAALACCMGFALSLLKGSAPRQPDTRTWWRGAAIALVSVAIAAVLVAALRDPSQPWDWPPPARILRYLGWAALQQVLIGVIVAERFARLTGSARLAVLLAAFVFALLHAPNAMLMQFTFLGGLIWIRNWQLHRALLANTLAHAACGLLLASGLPPDWLRSAEIGARYFLF